MCGLFHCGECGRFITAEAKIKKQQNGNIHRYLYYRCTKRNVKCSQPHIRSEELEQQLSSVIAEYAIPKEWSDKLLSMAEKDRRDSHVLVAASVSELSSKINGLDRKLERLFSVYMDQDIDQERYRLEKNYITSEKKTLTEQIARLEHQRNIWFEPLKNFIKEAENLNKVALSPSLPSKKSAALKIFGSHLHLKNRKIESTPQNQWTAIKAAHEKISKIDLSCLLAGVVGFEVVTCW